ncbi:MAG: hypothetical protein HS104_35120 [Polyangiaceae bacterium]|nr:hypothetical protein [Polyangiaceae bacterium]MCL4752393.1 hypothetical protein [Myxococcales bacterium]
MMRKVSFVVLATLVAACGGSVEQDSSAGGGGGSGGAGAFGGGGAGGGSGGGGMGGAAGFGGGVAGGGMGGIAGAAGAVGCGRTYDTLEVTIEPSIGESGPACSMSAPVQWQATGRVAKTSKNVFVLDTCPPNADCMPMFATVSVSAKDLELWVPENAFVSVKYALSPAWGDCTSQISVKNVPSWGGEQNPVSASGRLYFAGTDGQIDNSDAPLAITEVPLGCPIGGTGCGGQPPDDFKLVFNVGPGDPGTHVGMGESKTVMAPEPLQVHNLRSFVSGACDDYWNWAWWAAWVPTSNGTK